MAVCLTCCVGIVYERAYGGGGHDRPQGSRLVRRIADLPRVGETGY